MAMTTVEVARALRLSVPLDDEVRRELDRLLGVAQEAVGRYAPRAPDAIRDEAILRVCGYLYDAPTTTEPGSVGRLHPLRLSGAAPLLAPWRIHSAGVI